MTSSPGVPMITSFPSVPTMVAGRSKNPHGTLCAVAPGAKDIRDTTATATTVHETTSLGFIHFLPTWSGTRRGKLAVVARFIHLLAVLVVRVIDLQRGERTDGHRTASAD